jgi:hypothetical protein
VSKLPEVVVDRARNLIPDESIHLVNDLHRAMEIAFDHQRTDRIEVSRVGKDHIHIAFEVLLGRFEALGPAIDIHHCIDLQTFAVLFSFRCFDHTNSVSELLLVGKYFLRDRVVCSPFQEPLLKLIAFIGSCRSLIVLKLLREVTLDVRFRVRIAWFVLIHHLSVYRNPNDKASSLFQERFVRFK